LQETLQLLITIHKVRSKHVLLNTGLKILINMLALLYKVWLIWKYLKIGH